MFWGGFFFRPRICHTEASCKWEAIVPEEEVFYDGNKLVVPDLWPAVPVEGVHFGSLAVSDALLEGSGAIFNSFACDFRHTQPETLWYRTPQCLPNFIILR